MRQSVLSRETTETAIQLDWHLDGEGTASVRTGVGFFDHMLILAAKHGLFDLTLTCDGDLEVDQHHTVEDSGILLGQAFGEALGDKAGINRYATVTTPMDEALAVVSLDISGRGYLVYHVDGLQAKAGQFDTELVKEFFLAFARHAGVTLHVNLAYGENTHHTIEAIFKSFGRALDEASRINERVTGVPSTKGML